MNLPKVFNKLAVQRISQKFREAVEIVSTPLPQLKAGELLIKNRYVGINASDINHSAGRYNLGLSPPFDCGFEGVGKVVAVGPNCQYTIGKAVAYVKFGAFSEYTVVPEKIAYPLPTCKAEYVPLLVSGTTAALSLKHVGEIKRGDVVLVTAAAGGTGQFAVQIAKNEGCHVIGTCSTDEKVQLLKDLGCDRPINYSKENLKDVLKNEYPKGIDVVYETIGGQTFDTCLDALAHRGRLVVIGFIEGYENDFGVSRSKRLSLLPAILLKKSASVRGFLLFDYNKETPACVADLVQQLDSGKIKSTVDNGKFSPKGPFQGIESLVDAVEYLYSRKSVGKIIAELPDVPSSKL